MQEISTPGLIIGLTFWIVILIAIAGFIKASIVLVQETTEAIIERLGKYNRTAKAGLNFKIPFIEKVIDRVSLKAQQMTLPIETKTKDNVFVKLDISVQLAVTDVYSSNYKLTNPASQISSYVFDVVRASVPKMTLDEVFEKKDDIATEVKKHLAETMKEYGFVIIQALVLDVNPENSVKEAMNKINASQRLMVAAQNEGEANKVKIIKAAEAESESKKLQGEGIANQRKAIVDGLKESVEGFSKATGEDAKAVMNLVLMTQYFDTMKEIGGNGKVIFMSHSPSSISDIRSQMMEAIEGSSK